MMHSTESIEPAAGSVAASEIHARVDRLLMEQGEYAPLELLLAMDLLDYEDYRAWREGIFHALDGLLAEDAGRIGELIREAGFWAERLELKPEAVEYHGWKEGAGTVLVLSSDPELDRLLRTRFRRGGADGQADLFLDTAPARAVTRLADALAAGDAARAWEELAGLDRLDPGHRRGGNARTLIGALGLPPPIGTGEGYERLKIMEREWAPAASDLLGSRARDFLVPFWRGIGRALEGGGYDPGYPERHASRAYREGLDWESTRRSVLAVPEPDRGTDLFARLAEACWRLRDRPGAIEAWFALCGSAPQDFGAVVNAPGFPDGNLKAAWKAALEQDLEPETACRWLPSWMLLEDPGLAGVLKPNGGGDPASRAFETIRSLLRHPEPDARGLELRAELKVIHPGLLERFLEER